MLCSVYSLKTLDVSNNNIVVIIFYEITGTISYIYNNYTSTITSF